MKQALCAYSARNDEPMSNTNIGMKSPWCRVRWSENLRDRKRVALIISIGLLVVFPDVAILIVLKMLYFAVSWLSLMFKHALQEAFDISRHSAQMITAWIEAAALITFNIWLFRKLNKRVQDWYLRRFDKSRG